MFPRLVFHLLHKVSFLSRCSCPISSCSIFCPTDLFALLKQSLVAKYIALEHKNALKKAKAKAEAKAAASLTAKEEELRALRARVSTLETSPTEPEAKVRSPSFSKAQKEISRLSALLEESRAEVLRKMEEAESFKERLGRSEEKLMTSEEYIFLLKERLESARKDTDIVGTQLGSKLRQRDDELEAAHNERDELLHRVLHTGLQLQEVQKQREAERREAAVKEAALEVEVEKLTAEIAALEEEKTATAQRLGSAFAEKDAQTARARRERDEMAKELEALGAIADVLQRELVKTGERARDLEADLRMAREEAKQQREELRVQVGTLQRKLEAMSVGALDVAAVQQDSEKERETVAGLRAKLKVSPRPCIY
jgi:DNA repair exonuclease SbcCD ATPase subunit